MKKPDESILFKNKIIEEFPICKKLKKIIKKDKKIKGAK